MSQMPPDRHRDSLPKITKIKTPYDYLTERIKPIVYYELKNNQNGIQLNTNCDFCQRDPSQFGFQGIAFKNSYRATDYICKTCNLFAEQLPLTLGIERGKIGYKLSSFQSGYLLIPFSNDEPIELWLGGKYLNRINKDGPILIRELSGNKAKHELYMNAGNYAVAIQLSLRKEMYLRYLRVSTQSTLHVATDEGSVPIIGEQYKHLVKSLKQDDLNKKQAKELIASLYLYNSGDINIQEESFQQKLSKLSDESKKAIFNITNPVSMAHIVPALRGAFNI